MTPAWSGQPSPRCPHPPDPKPQRAPGPPTGSSGLHIEHQKDSVTVRPPRVMSMEWWEAVAGIVPVATVVSVAVTFLVRWLDTSRAVFAFEMQLNRGDLNPVPGLVQASIAVTNSGDGVAFDVEFLGHWCDAAVALDPIPGHSSRYATRLPRISPGDTVVLRTATPKSRLDESAIVMTWRLAPERPWPLGRRRSLRVPLGRVASAMPLPPGAIEAQPLPRLWRLHRDPSRLSPRVQLQDPKNHPAEEPSPPREATSPRSIPPSQAALQEKQP